MVPLFDPGEDPHGFFGIGGHGVLSGIGQIVVEGHVFIGETLLYGVGAVLCHIAVVVDLSQTVADTGAEIPEDSLNRIFQKFYQVDKSHATQGNGIGLSVAKAIVELHGGRISASSGDGETIVSVELPRKRISLS